MRPRGMDLQQPTIEQALHHHWDLGLPGLWAAAPAAQEEAMGEGRLLAKARAELLADQGALGGGEGTGREGWGRGHDVLCAGFTGLATKPHRTVLVHAAAVLVKPLHHNPPNPESSPR